MAMVIVQRLGSLKLRRACGASDKEELCQMPANPGRTGCGFRDSGGCRWKFRHHDAVKPTQGFCDRMAEEHGSPDLWIWERPRPELREESTPDGLGEQLGPQINRLHGAREGSLRSSGGWEWCAEHASHRPPNPHHMTGGFGAVSHWPCPPTLSHIFLVFRQEFEDGRFVGDLGIG